MRIGIDIDNVIADLDKTFLEEFEKEDRIYLPFDELERDRKPYSGK